MRETLQACCLIGLVFASPAVAQNAAPDDMKNPRLSAADVDWSAVRATLTDFGPLKADGDAGGTAAPDVLTRLNAAIAKVFPKIAASPVPVLLPFDIAAYLHDAALGAAGDTGKYLSGFSAATLFFPGPSGFDAVLALRVQDAPDLNLTFARPVNVQMSGSALLYELDGSVIADETAVPQLDGEFPGIRRVLIENHLRYSFVRYGVPYFVSIECFDGANSSRRLSCREADKVAIRFLKALNVVGGAPPINSASLEQQPIERPEAVSPDFTYYAPGDILPGTGSRGKSGRADSTVYAKIRFPMAQGPAYANSQSFMNWGNCDLTGRIGLGGRDKSAAYRCRVNDKTLLTDESKNYAYPWRDNFCEHRDYYVGQCPSGLGHQGQDIRPGFCLEHVEGAGRCDPYQEDVVAVADGVVMRSPGDRSLYLVVDKPGEHIRFRYLHMNPQMLDAAGMVSGREVVQGEVLGAVGNYGREPGGTTYHLHFDAQVPTRDGWVFVNPYMTLVAAYERLIGARGQVVNDTMFAPPPPPAPVAADGQAPAADTIVGPRADAKQSIDDSLKIENKPKGEPKGEGERKTAAAEHCTTYVHHGHRRQICRSGVAESSSRQTVRSGGRRISRQGRGARHHG
jgi:murein DD-endopeptidase MepM/ murein hydrolase activator NlpD